MSQSKLGSFLEACANIAVGMAVALASQWLIFPLYGWTPPLSVNLQITCWFTVISLARSYVLRRYFNGLHWGNR